MDRLQPLRLGTRASALARWQADWVAGLLIRQGVAVETVPITTKGDVRDGPIGAIGSQGVFTKEIQAALLDDRIDLAVHSLKDLPTVPVPGLVLAAVPPRATADDVLVSHGAGDFDALPARARVGTGSTRRRAQLLYRRRDLQVLDIRGNVDTRLRLLDEGRYDALVLAAAGLQRLGLASRIGQLLPTTWMVPAVGQGALGVEVRADDMRSRAFVQRLDDEDSHRAVLAERALLANLQGGCLAPVGAFGRVTHGLLHLDACVLDPQGTRRLAAHVTGPSQDAEQLGRRAADELLRQGAADLITAARGA
ncbi:MAG: hydroxymethylbilane synthase [Planctomycetes bacterium]|nr:hydroxymethylbilane synthase [Planctomycetota bacterium]